MTRIPIDPIGWTVEGSTIHTRYPDHPVSGNRTRTKAGVLNILAGKKGKACVSCYGDKPAPLPDDTPRPPQRRRLSTNGTSAKTKGTDASPSALPRSTE